MTLTKKILPLAAVLVFALPAANAFASPKSKLRFSNANVAVAEGDPGDGLTHNVTIQVTRKKFLNQAISVHYRISGSATLGADYTGTADGQPLVDNGTISWAAGDGSAKSISIDVTSDFTIEGVETIGLQLTNPSRGAMVLNPNRTTVSIVDNDGPTQVQLDSASYAGAEGDSNPIAVHVLRSGDLTGSSSVSLTATDVTTAIGSDYNEAGGNAQPHVVTFAPGQFDREVDFNVVDDSAKETTETFNTALSSPSNATLGAISSATASILDNDAASVFRFDSATYSVGEGDGEVEVTVVRDTDPNIAGSFSGTSSVDWTTADGSAVAPDDYTAAPSSPDNTLGFDPGDSEASFTIPVVDDSLVESDETFLVGLANPSGGQLSAPSSANVTIHDNDTPTGVPSAGGTTQDNGSTGGNGSPQNSGTPEAQVVLGARQTGCGVTVKASKTQKLLKQSVLKLQLRSVKACKVSLATVIKQLASKKRQAQIVRALQFKGKKASLTLQPGKAKTVKVKFTKKTLKAITKALRARKKLVATVVVTSKDSASKATRKTLRITIRR
jgi:hypothetical protein